MVRDSRAASIKGWETRRRMLSSQGFGPKGRKRGTEAHKVKSVSEIFVRLQARSAVDHLALIQKAEGSNPSPATSQTSGGSSYSSDRTDEAGSGKQEWKTAAAARDPDLIEAD